MFGSRFKKSKSDAVTGFLGSQTEFTGTLMFSGVVHLEGAFQGEIFSRGTLVVGSESVVEAHIQAHVLKIAGEVHGDLTATQRTELYASARVFGNIRTPRLIVEEGAFFEGTCSMATVEEDLPILATPEAEGDDALANAAEDLEAISAEAWPPPERDHDEDDTGPDGRRAGDSGQ
jgi:cytoskeletal protein CcmA (bactofilin family)